MLLIEGNLQLTFIPIKLYCAFFEGYYMLISTKVYITFSYNLNPSFN